MADDKKRDDIELGERRSTGFESPVDSPRPAPPPAPMSSVGNNPIVPVLSYCASSISMTVTNKFVLGAGFNLNFFLLAVQVSRQWVLRCDDRGLTEVQSIVCVIAIQTCKFSGVITYRDFNSDEAKKCTHGARCAQCLVR